MLNVSRSASRNASPRPSASPRASPRAGSSPSHQLVRNTSVWGELIRTAMTEKKDVERVFTVVKPKEEQKEIHVRSLAEMDALVGKERELMKRKIHENRREYSKFAMIYGIAGLAAHILENEVRYANIARDYGETADPWDISPPISVILIILHCIISISTCLTLFFVFRYHQAKYADAILERLMMVEERFVGSKIFISVVSELFVCCVHIPPNIFATFQMETADHQWIIYSVRIVNCFMFLRLYLVYRWMRLNSRTCKESARALGTMFDIGNSKLLSLKDFLYSNAVVSILLMYLATMCLCAYLMMIFERPVNHSEQFYPETTYAVAFWYVWVIMTTVGLGDWVPLSLLGRITSVVTSMFGLILTALFISTVSKVLDVSQKEEKMLSALNRVQINKATPIQAANVISMWYRHIKKKGTYTALYCAQLRRWRKHKKQVITLRNQSDSDVLPLIQDIFAEVMRIGDIVDAENASSKGSKNSQQQQEEQPEEPKVSAKQAILDQLKKLEENQAKTAEVLAALEKKMSQLETLKRGILGPFMAT